MTAWLAAMGTTCSTVWRVLMNFWVGVEMTLFLVDKVLIQSMVGPEQTQAVTQTRQNLFRFI